MGWAQEWAADGFSWQNREALKYVFQKLQLHFPI